MRLVRAGTEVPAYLSAVLLDDDFVFAGLLLGGESGFGGGLGFGGHLGLLVSLGFHLCADLLLLFLLSYVRGLFVREALHALFEAAQAFAESFAEFRQLLAAEQQNGYASDDKQVPRLKDVHDMSPCRIGHADEH